MGRIKGWENSKRIKLTINGSSLSKPLIDYWVSFRVEDHLDYKTLLEFFAEFESYRDRKKIAVTLADGVEQCQIDIASWKRYNKEALLLIKVPLITAKKTVLYLYFDKLQANNTEYIDVKN